MAEHRKILCNKCKSHDFDYDDYWKEYSCKKCGWIVDDAQKISALDKDFSGPIDKPNRDGHFDDSQQLKENAWGKDAQKEHVVDASDTVMVPAVEPDEEQEKVDHGETVFASEKTDDSVEEIKEAEGEVPVEWNVGDVILNLYDVTGVLGEGGMGKVYKVHHRNWNIDLAVKSPLPEALSRAGGKENFIREAETWVNLGLHPNTVACFYVRTLGDIPRVFAEFVDGGSLKDWIGSGRLYEGEHDEALERILDIAIQFAWGIDYAHQQGLVHQDIKPANVMMTVEGTAKVTDFGLSKARPVSGATASMAKDQSILVTTGGMTEAYCSPEQWEGKPLSRKTDIWSWGVSILDMFIGGMSCQLGFTAAEALEGYVEHGIDDEEIPSMPSSVSALLRRCFYKNPDTRPATIAEVADQLKTIYEEKIVRTYTRPTPDLLKLQADGLSNKGVSYFDLGKKEDSVSCWQKALEIIQMHPEATYNMSLVQWRDGKIDDLEILRRLDNCGKNPGLYRQKLAELRSFIHAERLDFNAARDVLKDFQGSYENLFIGKDIDKIRSVHAGGAHTESVSSVAITADGKRVVSGSSAGTIRIWDVETGSCIRRMDGNTGTVQAVAITPDGRCVVSGDGSVIRLWNLEAGQFIRTMEELHGRTNSVSLIRSVAITPDGKFVVSRHRDKTVRVWEFKTGRCIRFLKEQTGSVRSVAITPKGSHVVYCSDMSIRVWELKTGKCISTMEGHTGRVNSVAISSDGKYVISGGNDMVLRVWEFNTNRCIRTMKGHTFAIFSVTASTDGKYAISCSHDNTLRLWNLDSGRCMRSIEGFPGLSQAHQEIIAHNGKHVVSCSGLKVLRIWKIPVNNTYQADLMLTLPKGFKKIKQEIDILNQAINQAQLLYDEGNYRESFLTLYEIWKGTGFSDMDSIDKLYSSLMKKGKTKGLNFSFQKRFMEEQTHPITSVAITYDGRYLASGSDDPVLRVWELKAGQCISIMEGHSDRINSVAISPDGKYVVSGSNDRALRAWEFKTGQCISIMEGHSELVNSVAISSDGKYVVSGSGDHIVRMWELKTGRCIHIMEGHTDSVFSITITPDNSRAVSGSRDYTLRVWNLETGHCIQTMDGNINYNVLSLAISPDGKRIVEGSEDNALRVWDFEKDRYILIMGGHTGKVKSVAITPDGKYAVSGSWDHTVRVWDLKGNRCKYNMRGHTDSVESVSVTRDSEYAISGSRDKTIRVWNLNTGQCISVIKELSDCVTSLAITPDSGYAVSGGDDKTIRIWELKTGRCVNIMKGHTDRINSVSITPNGRYAVSGGDDKTIRIWELKKGRCVSIMEGHTDRVNSVAITPGGWYAISGSDDQTIRVWDLQKGQYNGTMKGNSSWSVRSVKITHDGRRVIEGSMDNTLRVWDLETGWCITTMEGHTDRVNSVAISSDDRYVVSGSMDKTIRVWDLKTGRCISTINGHTNEVFSVNISHDSRYIVSGSRDMTVRVWELIWDLEFD